METYILTCTPGLEGLLKDECLEHFPELEVIEQKGSVRFKTDLSQALSVATYSGIASRLFTVVGRFECVKKHDLQKGLSKLVWDQYLTPECTFSVSVHGLVEGKGHKRSFVPLFAKDILCDYFREKTGGRPSVDTKDPQVHFELYYGEKTVSVLVELTRDPLHRRKYRSEGGGKAPLRENLAHAFCRFVRLKEDVVLDPFCGSGTILIEMARLLSGKVKNPTDFNRGRPKTAFWGRLPEALKHLPQPQLAPLKTLPSLRGTDKSDKQLQVASSNVGRAEFKENVDLKVMDACNPPRDYYKDALILCNPPHGDRVLDQEKAKTLLGNFARKVKFDHAPCRMALLLPDDGLSHAVGFAPSRKLKVGAGEKTYLFLLYEIYSGSKKRPS